MDRVFYLRYILFEDFDNFVKYPKLYCYLTFSEFINPYFSSLFDSSSRRNFFISFML